VASIGKWNAATAVSSVLTTELNSLGNNTASAASAAIANQTNLDLYADFVLHLASLSPAAGAYVAVYILEALDDSTYPAPSDADLRLMTSQLLFVMQIGTTASTAFDAVARNVLLPPHSFKIKLDNQTGVALNASGNTLKISQYNVNENG
jgi:hypothetical protein